MDDNPPLREHISSLPTKASHEDEIFPPQYASPQGLLGLKYFDKIFLHDVLLEKGAVLLLRHAAFENGHT